MGYKIQQVYSQLFASEAGVMCFMMFFNIQVPSIERYERLQRKKQLRQDDTVTMEMDREVETEMPETVQDSDSNYSHEALSESVDCKFAECPQQQTMLPIQIRSLLIYLYLKCSKLENQTNTASG